MAAPDSVMRPEPAKPAPAETRKRRMRAGFQKNSRCLNWNNKFPAFGLVPSRLRPKREFVRSAPVPWHSSIGYNGMRRDFAARLPSKNANDRTDHQEAAGGGDPDVCRGSRCRNARFAECAGLGPHPSSNRGISLPLGHSAFVISYFPSSRKADVTDLHFEGTQPQSGE